MREHTSTTPRTAARVAAVTDRAAQVVGAACLALMLVLVTVQVVQRVVTGESWAWNGEIARFAMVWMTFVLLAHLLRTDKHLTIDVVEQLLTPRGERVMRRLTDGLVAVVAVGLVWAGWGLLNAPFLGRASASQVPLVLVYSVPFAGLVLLAVTAGWLAVVGRPVAADSGTPTDEPGVS